MSTDGSDGTVADPRALLRAARGVDPLAPELVNLLAHLAPRPFPVDLLAEHAHRVPGRLAAAGADTRRVSEVAGELVAVGLLQRSADGVRMAGDLQSVVRGDLVRPQAAGYADAALRILEAVAEGEEGSGERPGEPRQAVILRHAPAVAARLTELGRAPDRALVLGARAVEARAAEEGEGAVEVAGRMVEIARRSRRLRDPFLVAALLDQLAELRAARGETARAGHCLEEAVRIAEEVCPPDDPRRAVVLHNAGDLWRRLDRPGQAAELLDRCLGLLGEGGGPEDSLRVRATLDLAEALLADGRPGAAAEASRAAVEACRRRLGSSHPETAAAWSLWGRALQARSRGPASAACFRRALATLEETYGDQHPALGPDLGNLAECLAGQGDRAGARRLHGRAARIFREAYGEDHRLTRAAEERRRPG